MLNMDEIEHAETSHVTLRRWNECFKSKLFFVMSEYQWILLPQPKLTVRLQRISAQVDAASILTPPEIAALRATLEKC